MTSEACFGATLAEHRAARPEAIAIRPLPEHPAMPPWSREGLHQAISRIAAMLAAAPGFAPGMRIGWIGPNEPPLLALFFACVRLGITLVQLNWRLSAEELRWIEADADFRILCAPCQQRPGAPAFTHPYIKEFEARCGSEGRLLLDPAMASAGETDPPPDAPAPDTPLLIGYTSGTTGRPKGAVLTQAAFAANAANAQAIFGFGPADRVLTVLPLFHVGGLNIQTVPALLAGAELLLPQRFDPDGFFDAVALHRPGLTLLVPAVMQALVAHPRWATADLGSLRAIGAGSSEVPLPLIEAFHARGIPVQQIYGATETAPIAIAQSRAEALAHPGSIGLTAPLGEACIQDPEGRPLPPGAEGEIAVRGPNVMQGYWRAPGATAAVLRDGWFATGDIGRMDAEGRFWFTDRLKHLIISGGENVYPAEVERVLATAPGVLEGAVCGRPDPRWGEVPVAVVVPGPGFDRASVLRHFEGRLARFKQPRDLVLVAALPRNALGKVQLAALRALAAGSKPGTAPDRPWAAAPGQPAGPLHGR